MYIEYVAMENLILFTFVVVIYAAFLNIHMTRLRYIYLIFFMTICSMVIKIFFKNSIILTIMFNIFCVYMLGKIDNIKTYVKRVIYYFTIFVVYIGCIFFITLVFKINASKILNRILVYVISGILLKIFTDILWKMWINKIKYSENLYKLQLFDKVKFYMFLDSGNFATFRDMPVIIINEEKYTKKLKKYKFNISVNKPYDLTLKTINGENVFKGYIFEDIVIKKGEEFEKKVDRVFVTFTKEEIKENIVDGIIPLSIFIEK